MIVTKFTDDYRLSLGMIDRMRWLNDIISPRTDSIVGYRPDGLFAQPYWAKPEVWTLLTSEFKRLTGITQVQEFIRIVKGEDWTLFKAQPRDGFDTQPYVGIIYMVFDYEPHELMYKLAFS